MITIGMAVYREFDSAWFTLQALRAYHPPVELLVINSAPEHSPRLEAACGAVRARYVHRPELTGTAAPRAELFSLCQTDWLCVIDPHVLLEPDAVQRLIDYAYEHPHSNDLIQGPLVYDDGSISTHWRQERPGALWGTWADDEEKREEGRPFEIEMSGLGLFAMRANAFPGFTFRHRGFGGEEGTFHERVRRRGGKTLCVPQLGWRHLFRDPTQPPPYRLDLADHVTNLLLAYREFGMDPAPIWHDFGKRLPSEAAWQKCVVDAAAAMPRILAAWYSNNAAPEHVMRASLASIRKAAKCARVPVEVVLCPWEKLEGVPEEQVQCFAPHVSSHLSILLQQQRCMTGRHADAVSFLEHDVLYPHDYFDRVAAALAAHPTADGVVNLDYEGANPRGWCRNKERHEPMHQMTLRWDAAVENIHGKIGECLKWGNCCVEPDDKAPYVRIQPKGDRPAIHLQHAHRFTSHHEACYESEPWTKRHPYWGNVESFLCDG
jgi:hypothetical protein